ncbi:MAG: D-tyrosyl-tRNA(Tyr) deacylase [Armatimonadetes bacterium]|nr:D-tyrosyl-tRNA(Tyr) deacylase [Armatimonadota bacterium]
MRAVIQRVSHASVAIGGAETASIETGLLVLVAVHASDGDADAAYIAEKTVGLRVFPDDDGKMNLSVAEAGGGVLVISQFTLYGDVRRGRRPSFIEAAPPEIAVPLYERVCAGIARSGVPVSRGVFGAHMEVGLVNDGPVTILLDSRKAF